MISYNHAAFIQKAIDSILQQETDFSFELIIGDDFSNDKTKSICYEYALRYPSGIRILPSVRNVGVAENFKKAISACHAKYIAFCEGDDYWLDPHKLQKQINFLEANPRYILCSTRYQICNTGNNTIQEDSLGHWFSKNPEGKKIDLITYFSDWFTKTLTVVAKRNCININEFNKYKYFRDTHLFYHLLKQGPGYCFNFFGGVYNVHGGGVWSSKDDFNKLLTGYNVFNELYHHNKSDLLVKNKYLECLRFLIDKLIESEKRPLFKLRVYKHLTEYLTIIKSQKFLSHKIKKMWVNTFSYS